MWCDVMMSPLRRPSRCSESSQDCIGQDWTDCKSWAQSRPCQSSSDCCRIHAETKMWERKKRGPKTKERTIEITTNSKTSGFKNKKTSTRISNNNKNRRWFSSPTRNHSNNNNTGKASQVTLMEKGITSKPTMRAPWNSVSSSEYLTTMRTWLNK